MSIAATSGFLLIFCFFLIRLRILSTAVCHSFSGFYRFSYSAVSTAFHAAVSTAFQSAVFQPLFLFSGFYRFVSIERCLPLSGVLPLLACNRLSGI